MSARERYESPDLGPGRHAIVRDYDHAGQPCAVFSCAGFGHDLIQTFDTIGGARVAAMAFALDGDSVIHAIARGKRSEQRAQTSNEDRWEALDRETARRFQ